MRCADGRLAHEIGAWEAGQWLGRLMRAYATSRRVAKAWRRIVRMYVEGVGQCVEVESAFVWLLWVGLLLCERVPCTFDEAPLV